MRVVVWFPLFLEIISIQYFFVYLNLSGCFFHPDRPPVIYQVEIVKVVEKADVEI